jgi:hypothetical protein
MKKLLAKKWVTDEFRLLGKNQDETVSISPKQR